MKHQTDLSDAKRTILARMLAGNNAARPIESIAPRPVDSPVPLSAGQRQVWLHEQVTGDSLLYTESVTFHRHGSCDVDALRASVQDLLERHESLRAYLVFKAAEPGLAFRNYPDLVIPFDDLSSLPGEERNGPAIALATGDARRPFDLASGPLCRARIVRLAPEDHRVYLTLHHIVFDGVTIYDILLPDLAALYQARVERSPPPMRPSLGYGDYAVWQRGSQDLPETHMALNYWRLALTDLPEKIHLGGDFAGAATSSRAGEMETFSLSAALGDGIRTLGRANDATPYMILLAGFSALIHRYTGVRDFCMGGVTDMRRKTELAAVAGYFLNTVPLRFKPAPQSSFAEYLGTVRRMVLDSISASQVPFDEVVRALDLRQSADVHPLFDILFSVEPPAPDFPAGWDLTQMDVEVGSAKFDLYLELDERPQGYVGRFLYSSEKFDRATIQRIVRHWLMVLEQVTTDPAVRLGELSLEAAEDRAVVATLIEASSVGDVRPFTDDFSAVVERQPECTAIRFGDRVISYRELDAMANGVARALNQGGCGAGSLVGVLLDRSPEMVAALIGILRSGAAYLSLDRTHPPARLAWIVADAKVDLMLVERASDPQVLPPGVPRLLIADCCALAEHSYAVATGPTDLAYVIYTSGSTGVPKGVEIEHGALGNLLTAFQSRTGFGRGDSLLAVTTIAFDIAMLELFLPLMSGGTLILAPTSAARDMAELRALVVESEPTLMQATPASWRALVEEGLPTMPHTMMLSGGEALATDLAVALRKRCARLWNVYGPTETTIWSTIHEVHDDETPVPIGRPIERTSVHVLGHDGWPVTPGSAGELFIGGAGLARGYRHRADLTAERFVEQAFAPGLRLYRTGDIVRTGPDGALQYLGRADNEEKIRGHRVAVEEVERALRGLKTVADAAVRSWPSPTGERMLVAYLVMGPDQLLDSSSFRSALAETLPAYMIPSRFQAIAALPLTSNLKIDRKALPAPTDENFARGEPQLNEREARLAALWRDVLRVTVVGRDDSFFDLGGTSLMIAALLRRIEGEFDCRMTMASIFRAHRLGEMALAVDEDHAIDGLIPIQPRGTRAPLLWIDGGPKFRALGSALGPDQPFLGIPIDEALKDIERQPIAFDECAERIVSLIRAVRPAGPYYLGGWCTSGILAHAVAARLLSSGSEVPLVVLADAENPSKRRSLHVQITKTAYYFAGLVRQVGGERLRYLRKRLRGVINHVKAHPTFNHHGNDPLRDAMDIAALDYVPQTYGGPVALLCSREWVGARDAVNGWLPLMSGPVISRELAGDHDSLLHAPDVGELAAAIRDALNRAETMRAAT